MGQIIANDNLLTAPSTDLNIPICKYKVQMLSTTPPQFHSTSQTPTQHLPKQNFIQPDIYIQFKLMQNDPEGPKVKILPIPRYADKYKDMLQQSARKQKQSEDIQSIQKEKQDKNKQFFFYRIKTIGVGAHSFVYLVQQDESKILLAQKSITLTHAQEVQEDIIREIKILTLTDHQNIIKLYHFYHNETHLNLLMEYAEDSLFTLKQRFAIFKEKEVLEVTRQLLNGLAYLHANGLVHADVKLENIMIANGTVKLCDFGYAHKHPASSQQVVGTLEYLPPQYAQGSDSGPKRDIWAVGILAFEMLVGRTPFEGLKQNEKWTKLIKTPPSDYLEELIQLEKKMEVRSEKVEELIRHTLCGAEERWSADRLLKLVVFPSPQ